MATIEKVTELMLQNYNPKLYRRLRELGCRPIELAEVDIDKIIVEQGLYPRENTDWDAVDIYTTAVEEGDVFPPIIVVRKGGDGTYLLVDGNHRYWAHKRAGVKKIWIEIWDIPEHLIEYVATICNVKGRGKQGKDLKGSEKKKEIIKAFMKKIVKSIEEIAQDFETSVKYVRNVLSEAGLIKKKKQKMKERARELREEGLSYRQIAQKLSEEFGEKVSHNTIVGWFQDGRKFQQVENRPPADSSESAGEQTETQDKEAPTEYAKYKDTDIPLATIEYWVGECRSYVETGTPPEEAVEIVEVPEDNDVRKYVVEELKERFWNREDAEEEKKENEEEIQKWVEACKPYIDAGFEPKKAAEKAGVPEEIRVPVVKKLVGYKNHLHQEEEAKFKAELGPVGSRRRDIIIKAHQLVSIVQEIEQKLKELDRILESSDDEADQQMFRLHGRDQYIRDYLTFILVRGGWDKAEWFREITRRYVRYTLHPSYAKDFIEDMKEQAKLSPEEWEEISRKFWEEQLASEAELRWKKFCEALGIEIPKEYGGTK